MTSETIDMHAKMPKNCFKCNSIRDVRCKLK